MSGKWCIGTDRIPVLLGIWTALAADVFKGVEHRYGTSQEDEALQGGAAVAMGAL